MRAKARDNQGRVQRQEGEHPAGTMRTEASGKEEKNNRGRGQGTAVQRPGTRRRESPGTMRVEVMDNKGRGQGQRVQRPETMSAEARDFECRCQGQ